MDDGFAPCSASTCDTPAPLVISEEESVDNMAVSLLHPTSGLAMGSAICPFPTRYLKF
jgi:hypothetical protein